MLSDDLPIYTCTLPITTSDSLTQSGRINPRGWPGLFLTPLTAVSGALREELNNTLCCQYSLTEAPFWPSSQSVARASRLELDRIAVCVRLFDCLLPCADVTASCCCGPVGNVLGAESDPGDGPGERVMLLLLTVWYGSGPLLAPAEVMFATGGSLGTKAMMGMRLRI